MSYGVGAALQAAVYQRLIGDAALGAIVGNAIYDAVPAGTGQSTFVSIGPEDVRDRSDNSGNGAEHDFVVSVLTDLAGFQTAKAAATAISDSLVGAQLALSRGSLIGLWFLKAVARRGDRGLVRRIDLTFRARVQDN